MGTKGVRGARGGMRPRTPCGLSRSGQAAGGGSLIPKATFTAVVGVALDVLRGCTRSVGPALLHPVALPRLDHDGAVGGDAVAAAQFAQAHGARDELALEGSADPRLEHELRRAEPT
jgi:hypothetical protein